MKSRNLYLLFTFILSIVCLSNILFTKHNYKYKEIESKNLKAIYRADLGQELSLNYKNKLNALSLLNTGQKINLNNIPAFHLKSFIGLGPKSAEKLIKNKNLNKKQKEMYQHIL